MKSKNSNYDIKTIESLKRIHKNMMAGRYHIRGECDSTTNKLVLASREGKYFSFGTMYYDSVENLPIGTYYIDSDESY